MPRYVPAGGVRGFTLTGALHKQIMRARCDYIITATARIFGCGQSPRSRCWPKESGLWGCECTAIPTTKGKFGMESAIFSSPLVFRSFNVCLRLRSLF